jgi:hypothetical protein
MSAPLPEQLAVIAAWRIGHRHWRVNEDWRCTTSSKQSKDENEHLHVSTHCNLEDQPSLRAEEQGTPLP